jgi:hypothetical protein
MTHLKQHLAQIMIFSIAFGILALKMTWEETSQYAKNITLAPSIDNRIKYTTVLFIDNTECDVINLSGMYSFNTVDAAMERWNTMYLPNEVKRYEEMGHITTDKCYALLKPGPGFAAIIVIILLIISVICEVSLILRCCAFCLEGCCDYYCIPYYNKCWDTCCIYRSRTEYISSVKVKPQNIKDNSPV